MQAERRGLQLPDVVGDGQPRQRPLCSLRFRRRRPLPPTHGPGLLRHEHRPDTLHHARRHRVPQHGRLAGYGRFAQLQPPLRRPAAGLAQGGAHPCRQIDPDRRGMPLPALLVQRKRRRERSAPDPGRHRQNPELLRRLQQRDFPHGAHAREPQYPVADLCQRLRAEHRRGLRHLVVDAAVRQQQRLHRRFARGLQDLHGRRNRPQMAVQSHGASHRKAVHHLRHERGQGVLGHRRHGTQGLRRRQRPPKPRQGLFDGGRKCRLHQRLGL